MRIRCRNFVDASTLREMSSQLASQFDPLEVGSPFLLRGKLILQKISSLGILWDKKLPVSISERWEKWLLSLGSLYEFEIPCNCLRNVDIFIDNVLYQLHRFCDASNLAFASVIYLRRLAYGLSKVGFLVEKSRLVSTCQNGWVISLKELEAAKLCSEMMLKSLKALHHLKCSVYM